MRIVFFFWIIDRSFRKWCFTDWMKSSPLFLIPFKITSRRNEVPKLLFLFFGSWFENYLFYCYCISLLCLIYYNEIFLKSWIIKVFKFTMLMYLRILVSLYCNNLSCTNTLLIYKVTMCCHCVASIQGQVRN